jgi:hypothetical protein
MELILWSGTATWELFRQEKTKYVVIELYPEDLPAGSSAAHYRAYEKWCDDVLNVSYLMLATMSPNLHKRYEHVDAYTMI